MDDYDEARRLALEMATRAQFAELDDDSIMKRARLFYAFIKADPDPKTAPTNGTPK